MAYSSDNQAELILNAGIASVASGGLKGGKNIFRYCSSHGAADIVATGFFAGCGGQPFSSTGEPHYNVRTRSPLNIGMREGDAILNIESSLGGSPGRATWHVVTSSTLSHSSLGTTSVLGYNCSVSAHAST